MYQLALARFTMWPRVAFALRARLCASAGPKSTCLAHSRQHCCAARLRALELLPAAITAPGRCCTAAHIIAADPACSRRDPAHRPCHDAVNSFLSCAASLAAEPWPQAMRARAPRARVCPPRAQPFATWTTISAILPNDACSARSVLLAGAAACTDCVTLCSPHEAWLYLCLRPVADYPPPQAVACVAVCM